MGSHKQIGPQEGLLERGGKVAFYRMSVHWPKLVYPAFPDWIPTTRLEPRTRPRQVFSLLSNSSLLSQRQTTIYKAIFFVLDSSPKTLRNQIGNWLDWKQGFGVTIPPSEASLMTWNSCNEDSTAGSVQMASGFQYMSLPWSDFW